MNNCKKELCDQLVRMNHLISAAEKRVEKNKDLPYESVFVNRTKHGYQYYYKRPNGKKQYIRVKDHGIVKKYLQLDYDRDFIKKVSSSKNTLERFLRNYDFDAVENVYKNLNTGRKIMVTPAYQTDEEYIKEWISQYPEDQNSYPKESQYISDKGEFVRSKSEKILADMFYRLNIPYRYEPRLDLPSGRSIFPDFVLLNVKKRKTIYWEHFGLVTDGEYAVKALKKISLYENAGFTPGDDLLFSFESPENPLNTRLLEKKIKEKLLN